MEEGDKIDGNGPFHNWGNFGSINMKETATDPIIVERGNFLGADKAFFGVQFSDGIDQFYGWARVSMPSDGSKLTLHDLAYNENPGEHILAGEMSDPNATLGTPVPEPGTLGMLALGAAGVFALRRKKNKSASE